MAADGLTCEAASPKGSVPKRGSGLSPACGTEGNSGNPGKRRVPKFEPQGMASSRSACLDGRNAASAVVLRGTKLRRRAC